MSTARSKEDWMARIEPHLSTSIRSASDQITRTEAVQNWLHDASMEAAQGLGDVSGVQGEMEGYRRMMDALEDRFPALLDAVKELTDGHGHLELHWRPMNPNFSRLYIDFDQNYSVELLVRLTDPTPDAARRVLETVANALPEGSPFPNRPNSVTGLAVFDGRGVGVRVQEHAGDDRQQRYRTVTLLSETGEGINTLPMENAAESLLRQLAHSE